ncbi:hypothetical protein [Akkermansia muciniphila]|uniref:hypothetical protein n=1 Tax=Akkermansia muciniphila TaxID=239935 RepID=UPI00122F88A1|nr:hypothetical protein [Akkermansia muciniphila]KAA3387616.1 hypothetical protein F1912_11735 [Akkermansia muciniphila]
MKKKIVGLLLSLVLLTVAIGSIYAKTLESNIKVQVNRSFTQIESRTRSVSNNSNKINIKLLVDQDDEAEANGEIWIDDVLHQYTVSGKLKIVEGVYLGILSGSLDNSDLLEDFIGISVHYDPTADILTLFVSVGTQTETNDPIFMDFGTNNDTITSAVLTYVEENKSADQSSGFLIDTAEESQVAPRWVDSTSVLLATKKNYCITTKLYGSKIVAANSGGHASGVFYATKTDVENYFRNNGASVISGSATFENSTKMWLQVDGTSDMVFVPNAALPNNGSSSINIPIIIGVNPENWSSIALTVWSCKRVINQYNTRYDWTISMDVNKGRNEFYNSSKGFWVKGDYRVDTGYKSNGQVSTGIQMILAVADSSTGKLLNFNNASSASYAVQIAK